MALHGADVPGFLELDFVTFEVLGKGALQVLGFLHNHHSEAGGLLIPLNPDVDTDHARNSNQLFIVVAKDGVDVAFNHLILAAGGLLRSNVTAA
jgi:hypothetical protein